MTTEIETIIITTDKENKFKEVTYITTGKDRITRTRKDIFSWILETPPTKDDYYFEVFFYLESPGREKYNQEFKVSFNPNKEDFISRDSKLPSITSSVLNPDIYALKEDREDYEEFFCMFLEDIFEEFMANKSIFQK